MAHIGGSGTWGFRYPDGALDAHPHLSVAVVEPEIRLDTPFGPSPAFRLCRLTDRRSGSTRDFLYVWMHGFDPANPLPPDASSAVASERVFHALAQAGVRQVFADNSTGSIADGLRAWDLVGIDQVVDLSGVIPRPVPRGLIRFREGLCSRIQAGLAASADANLDTLGAVSQQAERPRLLRSATYVHSPGPWFESPIEDQTYRRLGYHVVGKTGGPEYRLARLYQMCFGMLSIVVNPAEGLGSFEHGDLQAIYRRCGPIMGRIMLEAIAASDGDECGCARLSTGTSFAEFSKHASYTSG